MEDRGLNFPIADLRGKSDKKEGPSTPGRPSLTPSKPFDYEETDATGWRTFKHLRRNFLFTLLSQMRRKILVELGGRKSVS